MVISISLNVIVFALAITTFLFGFFLAKTIYEGRLLAFIETLPEGKTLFLGEFSDGECDEILERIRGYAEEKNKNVSLIRK